MNEMELREKATATLRKDVVDCVSHPETLDPECEFCQAMVLTMNRNMQNLTQTTQLLEQEVQRDGVMLPPHVILGVRLEALYQFIAFGQPIVAMMVDAQYHHMMQEVLHEAARQARRAKLTL